MNGTSVPWSGAATPPPTTAHGAITLVHGTSFVICDQGGDIGAQQPGAMEGLFVADTRVCSRLVLDVDGRGVEALAWDSPEPSRARIVGRVHDPEGDDLLVVREHQVSTGLRTIVSVRSAARQDRQVTVRMRAAGDLAGLFEVKEGRATGEPSPTSVDGDVGLVGERAGRRGAVLRPEPTGDLVAADGEVELCWDVDLPAGGLWSAVVEVAAIRGGVEVPVARGPQGPGLGSSAPSTSWLPHIPAVRSDVGGLEAAFARALDDLGALQLNDLDHPDQPVVAAGAPWFMTLFGRDSLLTSLMALPFSPELALGTLATLARLQGQATVPATDEEPGKILHEVRLGATDSLAVSSGWIYYGSVDATPLFVVLAGELHRWGASLDQLTPLMPAVRAALGWMAGPGDRDGDGYLEYARATEQGLANQGWKDSNDSVSFADGTLAEGPIALAEVQGYAYAAWLAGADLAQAFGDHVRASEHRLRATQLQEQFTRDFVLPSGALAIALDGQKRPVDAIASNAGHCLWTGIVPPAQVARVAAALTGPDMASGWGLRTLSSTMPRYDPLSYHNGSVWPHDTAIGIAGLRRAGLTETAVQLACDLLDASTAGGGRLPELYAGLARKELAVPVPYPTSCQPQAWASAAPLLVLRALLGLEPDLAAGRVLLDPRLPTGATSLRVDGIRLGGAQVSIEVDGDAVAVRGLPRGLAVIRPPLP